MIRRLLKAPYMVYAFLFVFMMLPQNVSGLPNWQADIRIESGSANNRLTIGAQDTATDGYDPLWDTNALFGGSIEAYFPHPEWNRTHVYFQRDIRAHAPGITKIWSMMVHSTLSGSTFTVKWDLSNVPAGYPVILIDHSSGQYINLRSSSVYNFTYTDTRSFSVTVAEVSDSDGDGIPDDGDGSGIEGDNPCIGGNIDACDDNCKSTANPAQEDTDKDGIGDICDNCRLVVNPDQTDDNYPEDDNTDPSKPGVQHYGDLCDPDFDNDGLVSIQDYATWRKYYRQGTQTAPADVDIDGDNVIGLGDYAIWRKYYRNVPGPGIGD